MREPEDFTPTGPDLRTFSLNSDYAHWLTLADQEESMLPRVARPKCLNGRVEGMPPGMEGEDGSGLGGIARRKSSVLGPSTKKGRMK